MSQAKFAKQWEQTQSSLNALLKKERPKKPKPLPATRELCFEELSGRYVRYCIIHDELTSCYDHVVHPQKGLLLERTLDGVTGRVLEMRNELERLALSEYLNLVNACMDSKTMVEKLELRLGSVKTLSKMATVRQRARMLEYLLLTMEDGKAGAEMQVVCTISEAVFLIQRNQRGYAHRQKAFRLMRQQEMRKRLANRSENIESHIPGIIKCQALWRGSHLRRKVLAIRTDMADLVGMRMPTNLAPLEVKKREIQSYDYNKKMEYNDDFVKDYIVKSEEYLDTQGPRLELDMLREIREWVLEYRDIIGAFPQFPTAEEGGSLALFTDKSVRELEEEMDELEAMQNSGPKGGGKAADKGKKDAKKADAKGAKGAKKGEVVEFEMRPSNFMDTDLIPCAQEYGEYWMYNNERNNPQQRYDGNLLMDQIRKDTEKIIRERVDDLMRAELEKLEIGIDHMVPPKPKQKKVKPPKEKKKKKKNKDLTEGIPLDELYKELLVAGVIKKVPTVTMKDFVGEVNLMCPKDSEDMEFQHDLGDVRKMIFDYAILPMSSQTVHARAPLRKSIMIVGPHGSGKKMLVDIICTELGANLFDMSPENIDGIYEDSEGQKRLMHLVMKVGKLMEPSIIHIGNCDRMFTKKLPPEDTTKPGRMKKEVMKAYKSITPDDRIMFVGTSKAPFKAANGPLFKLYERLIFIYPPSSKSRHALWNSFIKENKGIQTWTKFQITPLAHVSKGYTAGDIKNATCEVLTENRLKRQQKYPLTCQEFVSRLVTFDPVFVEEQEEYEKWLDKTPLRKKLAIVKELEEEGNDVMGLL